MKLKDKYVLITGASGGIGRAISLELLESGAKVVGLSRTPVKLKSNAERYFSYSTDLLNLEKAEIVLKKIISEHPKINALVSNAGFGEFKPLENFSLKQIREFISLNLVSHIMVSQKLIKHFKTQKGGEIVIMGSEAGLSGKRKSTLYSAAKFGLRGFSEALRDEVSSSDIRVSLISPGLVRTNFFEKLDFEPGDSDKNAIEPADIAQVVCQIFLTRQGTIIEEVRLSPAKRVINFGKK